MKAHALLTALLFLLVLGLVVAVTLWVSEEQALAGPADRAQPGEWMMVDSSLRTGEGLLYMFNTKREVLLVYAYHRGRRKTNRSNDFNGDLQFLAGRLVKYDMLYSQLAPYPVDRSASKMHTPKEMETAHRGVMKRLDN